MSLAVLADHMASKGRGPDSMLIHMSPREVQGLQALAMANGGSLTINPDTGLPEAGFLDKLLPAIIGFAVTAATGLPAWQVGLGVGAVETARTGDLGKGISAGLGAYGGAGLGAGFSTAGAEAIGSQAAGQSYLASAPGVLADAGAGLSGDMAYNLTNAGVTDTVAANAAQQAAAERIAAATPYDKLSAGFDAAKANPSSLLTKDNFKYVAAAAAPVLADQAVKSNLPVTATKPGMIRPYSYDPYGGTYTAGTPYEAMPTKAADGGLMGMADGGYNPGQLNFAQQSEPVMRMAEGGLGSVIRMAGGTPPAMLSDEALYQQTGSWEAAAAARDAQNNALNQFNWAQQAAERDQAAKVSNIMADAARLSSTPSPASNAGTNAGTGLTQLNTNTLTNTGAGAGADTNVPAPLSREEQLYQQTGSWEAAAALRAQQDAAANTAKWKADADKVTAANKALVADPNYWTDKKGLAALDAGASDTTKWFAARGLGFNPIDASIENFLATYKTQLATMTPEQQTKAMTDALAKERLNEADVVKATGKTIAQLVQQKRADGSIIVAGPIADVPVGSLPGGVSGGGNTVVNANGTITTRPDIPGIPAGGFTGMADVRKAYTDGGGSLGVNKNLFVPKTQDELFARYKNTGGSKAALDYLMGKTKYSPVPVTETGEIMKPYWESVGRFPENRKTKKYVFVNGKYELNPDYVKPSYVQAGEKAAALSNQDKEPTDNPGAGKKWVWNSVDKKWEAQAIGGDSGKVSTEDTSYQIFAEGGLAALTMAGGGMPEQFSLGGYSDGGRLLRGPGDGVSDSIPATIGNKRPARLADGEFVVPARIVSELGNGSTEAGARKLYAMMDRVQAARKGSIGKGKVAKNSRSEKYLPA